MCRWCNCFTCFNLRCCNVGQMQLVHIIVYNYSGFGRHTFVPLFLLQVECRLSSFVSRSVFRSINLFCKSCEQSFKNNSIECLIESFVIQNLSTRVVVLFRCQFSPPLDYLCSRPRPVYLVLFSYYFPLILRWSQLTYIVDVMSYQQLISSQFLWLQVVLIASLFHRYLFLDFAVSGYFVLFVALFCIFQRYE